MISAQRAGRNMGSTVMLTKSANSNVDEVCPCQRPKTRILCSCCGYIGEGRIRYPCKKHANVIFINDFSQCPICKVHNFMLIEF